MSAGATGMLEELKKLPSADKLQIIDELWESVPAEDIPVPQEVIDEMERRYEDCQRHPGLARPWTEVEQRLRAKLQSTRS